MRIIAYPLSMDTKINIQRLREIRRAAGLKQRDLAEQTGVSFGTIAQYETRGGKKQYIYDLLIRACGEQIKKNAERYANG